MTLLTTTWTDDDGSGSVGTIINAAQLASIYQNAGHADNHAAGGRLTLTSGTPVTTADVTAATTIYYSPYNGDVILLYDGTATWNPISFAETSIAVPATTSQMYDLFGYNNSGSLALESLAWTNDTTRATALVLQNGILVKSGVTTRRYLGSFRTTGVSGQTEDSVLKRYLFNYMNRRARQLRATEATTSWTYSTATLRQANANAANQIDLVNGFSEDVIDVIVLGYASDTTAGATVAGVVAIGQDSTSALAAGSIVGVAPCAVNATPGGAAVARVSLAPAVGRHFFAWLEYAANATAMTFYGSNAAIAARSSGIFGMWWC